jgi:hypothetical protein
MKKKVEEALRDGKCTFPGTGKKFHDQEWQRYSPDSETYVD